MAYYKTVATYLRFIGQEIKTIKNKQFYKK